MRTAVMMTFGMIAAIGLAVAWRRSHNRRVMARTYGTKPELIRLQASIKQSLQQIDDPDLKSTLKNAMEDVHWYLIFFSDNKAGTERMRVYLRTVYPQVVDYVGAQRRTPAASRQTARAQSLKEFCDWAARSRAIDDTGELPVIRISEPSAGGLAKG